MDSIIEALSRHSRENPANTALLFEGRVYTYRQLYEQAARFAAGLIRWGLQPGDRVALFLENCPEFVIAYFGIHLARGVVVLVNTQYRQVELRHILSDSGARLAVTDAQGGAELDHLRADLPDLAGLVIAGEAARTANLPHFEFEAFQAEPTGPFSLPQGGDLALIGYTSGTTGRSKGAMLLHSNLAANIAAVTTSWQWTGADRLLLVLPLFHAHGLMVGLHGTIWTGASAELRPRFEVGPVLAALQNDLRLTMFFGVPTMYSRLLEATRTWGKPLRPLRLYVSGSAPLSQAMFKEFEQVFGQPILERYGMTETIMNTTNPYSGERRAGTVGAPFPGQAARIVDVQSRKPLPDGETGEIEVRGPHVFKGYWQQPEATAEALSLEGWFKTGDLGWRSPDGYLTINGRARELIISGGYNVYPREVEEVLLQHPGVAEAAVFGLPHPDLGEQVVAAVVPVPGAADLSAPGLADFCRTQLASFKKPRQVFVVESLPRNALGKIQKHLLRQQLEKA
jgi:malonyl-CoA/methylmalonyl-CoA synthetase